MLDRVAIRWIGRPLWEEIDRVNMHLTVDSFTPTRCNGSRPQLRLKLLQLKHKEPVGHPLQERMVTTVKGTLPIDRQIHLEGLRVNEEAPLQAILLYKKQRGNFFGDRE